MSALSAESSGAAVLPTFADLGDDGRAELWAALALRHSPGIGPRTVRRLLAGFGSALAAVQAAAGGGREWQRAGVRPHMAAPVAGGLWRETARREWDALRECRCGILLWPNPAYPGRLREIPDAPAVLYCRGDASLLGNHAVAVVGSRLSSRDGRRVASDIAYSLSAAGVTVVSGLARGIDRQAHEAALGALGGTIGVLGTGIDVVYPPDNADMHARIETAGLLVSEYAPGTLPLPAHFPVRNRIISGLSVGVLVVEAAARSGSLITARLALEQGREVYAVPGPATAQYTCGCRDLIGQGARAVQVADDMLADLAPLLGMELAALAAPIQPVSPAPPVPPVAPPRQISSAVPTVPTIPTDPTVLAASTAPAAPRRQVGSDATSAGKAPAACDAPVFRMPPPAAISGTPDHGPEAACPPPAGGPVPSASAGETAHAAGEGADPILAFLQARPGAHVDDICRALSLAASDASARLVLMEVSGEVRRLPGMRYERM